MPNIVDPSNGTLTIGTVALRPNLLEADIANIGCAVARRRDMKTGWVWISCEPRLSSIGTIAFSLAFYLGALKRASFVMVDADCKSQNELKRIHDAVLFRELGVPTAKNEWHSTYRFDWGEITSALHPKDGMSRIGIIWK